MLNICKPTKIYNNLTHIKKKSKIMYYKQNLIESKGNLSKTWKIVKEINNKPKVKTNIPPLATSTNASNPLDTFTAKFEGFGVV